jgi:hypothetical protein
MKHGVGEGEKEQMRRGGKHANEFLMNVAK